MGYGVRNHFYLPFGCGNHEKSTRPVLSKGSSDCGPASRRTVCDHTESMSLGRSSTEGILCSSHRSRWYLLVQVERQMLMSNTSHVCFQLKGFPDSAW